MKELTKENLDLVNGGVAPILIPLLKYYGGAALKIGSTYYWASKQS